MLIRKALRIPFCAQPPSKRLFVKTPRRKIIKWKGKIVDIHADDRTRNRRWAENLVIGIFCGTLVVVPSTILYYGIERVPYSNRRRLILAPRVIDPYIGELAMQSTINGETVLGPGDERYDSVQNICERLISRNDLKDLFDWEVYVIESDIQNAFCVPGGKMVVYTGIQEICKNDSHIGILLGHEMAHAIARHSMEALQYRFMFFLCLNTVGWAYGIDIFSIFPEWSLRFVDKLIPLVIDLPRKRMHELEADHIGLILATNAGFDPEEAPSFYENLGGVEKDELPEIFRTHPITTNRIAAIEERLQEMRTNGEITCTCSH